MDVNELPSQILTQLNANKLCCSKSTSRSAGIRVSAAFYKESVYA